MEGKGMRPKKPVDNPKKNDRPLKLSMRAGVVRFFASGKVLPRKKEKG